MGIYIRIEKYKEDKGIGYYEVSTQAFGGANFFIGIDINLKKIYIYLLKNCEQIAGEIDFNDEEKPINSIANIPNGVISRIIMKVLRVEVFEKNILPKFLSWEA